MSRKQSRTGSSVERAGRAVALVGPALPLLMIALLGIALVIRGESLTRARRLQSEPVGEHT